MINEAGAFPEYLTSDQIESYRLSLALEGIYGRPEFFEVMRGVDKLWHTAHSEYKIKRDASKPKPKSKKSAAKR